MRFRPYSVDDLLQTYTCFLAIEPWEATQTSMRLDAARWNHLAIVSPSWAINISSSFLLQSFFSSTQCFMVSENKLVWKTSKWLSDNYSFFAGKVNCVLTVSSSRNNVKICVFLVRSGSLVGRESSKKFDRVFSAYFYLNGFREFY